ncbi:hypothetical protein [Salinibacterium sp. M195]|uniref:hypothetical protein n=1 Tax=Salinibacterium sp. M195 TaxID=2583374 RepID=UPI001C625561|nr:hypothetical protein [Salinibacterium sp. M195]QYH34757.1 hypothetical protein FFT87_01675 [Salinibacterium sp. M195]
MSDFLGKQLVVVRVRGTDMEVAAAALREKLAEFPNVRVTALTERSSGWWDWTSTIQLLAAIEYTEPGS